MNFSSLPVEIRFHIFSHFTPKELCFIVAPVCKDWLRMSKEPILWQSVEIGDCALLRPRPTRDQMKRAVQRSPLARQMKFLDVIEGFEWASRLPELKFVQSLTLTRCSIKKNDTSTLVRLFPDVRTLSLFFMFTIFDRYPLDWIVRWKFLKNVYIVIDADYGDYRRFFSAVTENLQFVEKIYIKNCYSLYDSSVVEFLKIRGKNLTELGLGRIDRLTQESYKAFRLCPHLTKLHLTSATNMTDDELLILQELKTLKVLKIAGAENLFTDVTSTTFDRISFPQIVELTLTSTLTIDDTNFSSVIERFPNLQTLTLKKQGRITDVGLKTLPKCCDKLKFLYLSSIHRITNECLNNLTRSMSHLEVLKTKYCYDVNLVGVYVYNRSAH